jgi:hypothetical protein
MSRVIRTFEDYKKHPDYHKCLDEWSEMFIQNVFKLKRFQRFNACANACDEEIYKHLLSNTSDVFKKFPTIKIKDGTGIDIDYANNPNITLQTLKTI